MSTEEIFKQSGYTIPTDKHDECSKRFDYWDMIAFADLVIEKLKEQDSNLSQHLVSKSALDKPKKKNFKHNHKVCGCGRPYSQKDLEDGMCNKCYAPTM